MTWRGTGRRAAAPRSPPCARPTGTRPTRRSASRCSTTRPRWATPAAFQDVRGQRRLRVQLVLRQLDRRGVLQLRLEPGAGRRPPTRTCPTQADAGVRVAGLEPGHQHRHLHARVGPSAVGQPGLLRQLEQQAGARTSARRTATSASARCTGPTCSTARSRPAIAAGTKLDRAGVVKIMAEAAATDLRGQQVLGRPAPGDRQRSRSPTRRWPPRSPSCAPGSRPGPGGWRRRPGSKVYQHADAIRIFDAWWPLLVSAQFQPGLGAGPLRRRWSTPCRSTSRRRAARTGDVDGCRELGERGPGAQGLVVPVRLVGLRRQGPARRARRPGRRWARPRRTAATATSARAGRSCSTALRPGRRGAGRPRSTRATTPARPATSGAPTRSCSPPLGGITHAADRLAEPPHLPAGRVVPGAAAATTSPTWRRAARPPRRAPSS